ncbi:hypothetical protein V2J09_004768 [Rumex salicifolius]
MEAIKRQASKLREQVSKQQQALLKQLGQFDAENIMMDEEELKCHHHLQNLYNSTRECKHFHKDIVRGCQGFASVGSKQMDIVRKLAEDCCKYGTKEECSTSPLVEVALEVGASHNRMEKEREIFLSVLSNKVCEPLRALIRDPQLEDARFLIRHYEKLCHEMENQAIEVVRQRSKSKDGANGENPLKLQIAEVKLDELKSRLNALGKEANVAMSSVETLQQQRTSDHLLVMVDAERSYHQNVLIILDNLVEELYGSSQIEAMLSDFHVPEADTYHDASSNCDQHSDSESFSYFVARVIHHFDAVEEGELSLSVDDFVAVYEVGKGWCKGESKGEVGWFPSAYVEGVETEAE